MGNISENSDNRTVKNKHRYFVLPHEQGGRKYYGSTLDANLREHGGVDDRGITEEQRQYGMEDVSARQRTQD